MRFGNLTLFGTSASRQRGKTMRDNFQDERGLTQGTILVNFDALEGAIIPEADHVKFYYTYLINDYTHQVAVATAPTMLGPWTDKGPVIGVGLGGAPSDRIAHSSMVVKASGAYYCYASNGYGNDPGGKQDRCLYGYKSSDGFNWTSLGQLLNLSSFADLLGYGNTSVWPELVNGKYLMLAEITNASAWRIHRAEATSLEGPWTITQELTSLRPVAGKMYGGACHKYLNGKWHCWYHFGTGEPINGTVYTGQPTNLAYATSLDGVNWTIRQAPYFGIEARPYGPIQSISAGTSQIGDPYVAEVLENGVPYVYHTAEYVENTAPSKNQTRRWRWQGTLLEFVALLDAA